MPSHHHSSSAGVWLFAVVIFLFLLGLSSVALYHDEKSEERERALRYGDGAPGSSGVVEIESLGAELRSLSKKLDGRAGDRADLAKRIERTELALGKIGELEEVLPAARAEVEAVREEFADYRERFEEIQKNSVREGRLEKRMNGRMAEAQEELDEVKEEIERERKRFRAALQVINTLTENKTRAVTIGSSAYARCMAASAVIKEVEDGAAGLKADRRRLEEEVEGLRARE